MSKNYVRVPINAAKRIAVDYEKDQVIVITWDKKHGTTHVATYGKTLKDCEQAAIGGNMFKRVMGWPESLCNAMPARVRRKKGIKCNCAQVENQVCDICQKVGDTLSKDK